MLTQLTISVPILVLFYVLALAMILADLWAGVRKAKRAGNYISSKGLRRTVDKVCRYYNMMLLFTLVDVALIVSVQHYNDTCGGSLPAFPAFTLIATLMVAIMEGRSIYESLDRKTRAAAQDAAGVVAYLIKHRDDLDTIMDEVGKASRAKDKPRKRPRRRYGSTYSHPDDMPTPPHNNDRQSLNG